MLKIASASSCPQANSQVSEPSGCEGVREYCGLDESAQVDGELVEDDEGGELTGLAGGDVDVDVKTGEAIESSDILEMRRSPFHGTYDLGSKYSAVQYFDIFALESRT